MKRRPRRTTTNIRPQPEIFWLLVGLSFAAILLYRAFFNLPVWFDESVAKAFIFGLPFLLYMLAVKKSVVDFGLDPKKFWLGAYLGLALGGSFGFVALIASAVKTGGSVLIPNLFAAGDFWSTFGLALATAWWESLFFFGLILNVFRHMQKTEWQAVAYTTLLFILFHAPILIIRGGVSSVLIPLLLLAAFAFGQAVLYLRFKSLIAMVVSHAFWGMALLVYTLR